MVYYFAYGSNMNLRQMAYRCPGATPVGPARLVGYRLTERAYADIDRSRVGEVWGVVWELQPWHLTGLDRYEGHPTLYTRYAVQVQVDDQATRKWRTVTAIVYEMTHQSKRLRDWQRWPESYRQACAEGADENGLPVNEYA